MAPRFSQLLCSGTTERTFESIVFQSDGFCFIQFISSRWLSNGSYDCDMNKLTNAQSFSSFTCKHFEQCVLIWRLIWSSDFMETGTQFSTDVIKSHLLVAKTLLVQFFCKSIQIQI